MATSYSPLRYPGGKQILARVIAHLVNVNGREGGIYVEPFAGGGGAALSLLFDAYVRRIVINDADPRVHAFWFAVLNHTDRFLKLLRDCPLTVEEWKRQRAYYLTPHRHSPLRVGFATFYLNRCNRSGIIANAGLIGGLKQTGQWKMDARFNRSDLADRVERIADHGRKIELHNLDGVEFLKIVLNRSELKDRCFIYLDPPYYSKGSQLYLNHFRPQDHVALYEFVSRMSVPWVLSYDNVREVRFLYSRLRRVSFNLGYSARDWRIGKELLIVPDHLQFPTVWKRSIPSQFISARFRIPRSLPLETSDRKSNAA